MSSIKKFAQYSVNEYFFPEPAPLSPEDEMEASRVSMDGARVRELLDELISIVSNHPNPQVAQEAVEMLSQVSSIVD